MPSRYAAAHANPQGPGDARPTALQIIQDNNLSNTLNGKVALVTGISSGIGLETALALRAAGMHVFGAVRNISKTTAALGHHLSPSALELIELDMNSLSSVRACAASFLERSSSLHVLVTNAGIMMTPQASTQDGHEIQFGTNHLAHFLLFQLLKPTLLASATPEYASRVIALSSVGHRSHTLDFTNLASLDANGNYDTVAAYARSKLAAIYMANEIERRYGDRHLHAFSVMPGGIWSGLQASLPGAVVDAWKGDAEFQKAWKSAEQGAATTVWGAVAPELEGLGGKYLEDCDVAEQARDESNMGCPGFAGHAFDREAEQQLWRVSCELVGAGDED